MRIRAYADLHLYYNKDEIERYNNNELLELKNNLLLDPPDMLVFCGDLCHKTYNFNDKRFSLIIKFITEVVDICKTKNILFRIISGTSTHDGNIVDILRLIFTNEKHVECFSSVAYEKINSLVIRYLPEPYFGNYEEFKAYAFNTYADITFFHGSVDEALPMVKYKDSVTNLPKSIIMKKNDLIKNTKSFSAGGHIHTHINMNDKVFYINSLTTHSFADIGNIKGYMEFIVDNNTFEYKYIKNDIAPIYYEYKIEAIHNKSKEDIRSIIGNILISIKSNDKVRFNITGLNSPEAIVNVAFIKSLMTRFDIKIITKFEDINDVEISEDTSFYIDSSISLIEKIKKLGNDEYNISLSNDFIKKYIKK